MNQIKAAIIAHSKSSVNGKEIVTWELEYPRFIHSELMTHRLFSRNAASSRAIPVAKMIEQVRTSPAMPVHWGKNQPGMQAKEECFDDVDFNEYHAGEWCNSHSREDAWGLAARSASMMAESFSESGYHKQIVNRLLEPFQMMKTVVTATEFDNFFWLRKHPDAQPEIKRLAELMWDALKKSYPNILKPGDWHTPYYGEGYWIDDSHSEKYATHTWLVPKEQREDFDGVTLKDALAISSSCCAQVSYRKLDDSLEKALVIFAKLIESKPCHASPCEHQATPMEESGEFWDESGDYSVNCLCDPDTWQEGITHVDRNGNFWSGNFKGFVQHRQLIEDNVCWEYEEK